MIFEQWTGAKVLKRRMPKVFPERWFELWTEASIKRRLVKKVWIFLCARENVTRTQLTCSSFSDPLWFAFPLLMTFSAYFLELFLFPSQFSLRQIFALITYAFSCSFSRSSCRILPMWASLLTLFRVFLDSLYAFSILLSLIALSLSFQPIFTQNLFPTNLSCNNFLRVTKL